MKVMKKTFLPVLAVLSCSLASNAFASARILIDFQNRTATIRADFNFFCGPTCNIDDERATLEQMTEVAQKLWSGDPYLADDSLKIPLELLYQGYHLQVKADLRAKFFSSIEAAHQDALANQTPVNNYVRIDLENKDFVTATAGLGANAIHLLLKRGELDLTSLAHEFGHSMQLDHWQKAVAGPPSIMVERGFPAVDPQYCYQVAPSKNKKKQAIATVNPRFRRVTQADLWNLREIVNGWPLEKDGDVSHVDLGWNVAAKDQYLFRPKMKKSFWEKMFGNG